MLWLYVRCTTSTSENRLQSVNILIGDFQWTREVFSVFGSLKMFKGKSLQLMGRGRIYFMKARHFSTVSLARMYTCETDSSDRFGRFLCFRRSCKLVRCSEAIRLQCSFVFTSSSANFQNGNRTVTFSSQFQK